MHRWLVSLTRSILVGAGGIAATLAVAAAPVSAAPFTTIAPLVQVSGTSPFATCTADDVDGQVGGTNFPDSEVEPSVDVNPTDEDNIVGMWQQDRWGAGGGGARGHVVATSDDGGSTWSQVVLPHVTLCSGGTEENGGNFQRTSDPWVSFGPDGTLYQISVSFNDIGTPPDPEDFHQALLASTSTDGGNTWSEPEAVIFDTAPTVFDDKQTLTADPTDAGTAYAVWFREVFPPGERASVQGSFNTAAFRAPMWFARTTDGGESWEPARKIYDPGQNDVADANQIAVLPDGTLLNLFSEFRGDNKKKLRGWTVRVLRSSDQGESWSGPITVDRLHESIPDLGSNCCIVTDPETGDDVRTSDIIPDVAVDPDDGTVYVVWQDVRFGGGQYSSIALSQSRDGGLTWSTPTRVNATPTNIPPGNQQAFTPTVDVSDDGTVGVTYYDFRNNTAAPALGTDYWAVHCHPTTPTACTSSSNWADEVRITETTFDMRQAPDAGGFFTGDYEGLASAGSDFTPFFSRPHGSDPSSVFFRRVGP